MQVKKDPPAGHPQGALLKELRRVARLLGKRSLTQADFLKHGRVHPGTIAYRFGTWNKGLQMAGLLVSIRKNVPDEEVFEEIRKIWKMLGRRPSYDEFNQYSKFTTGLLQGRFGGYGKAMETFVKQQEKSG